MNIFKDIKDKRNPTIVINDITIQIIGDPHLGKSFKQGVPKDLLGFREQLSLNVFRELLNKPVNYIIIVGDLFDKFQVDSSVFYSVLSIIEESALSNPNTSYIYLNGNHDLSKEVDKISSFQLLAKYVSIHQNISNVSIILDKQESPLLKLEKDGIVLGLFHYNPFVSIDDEYNDTDLFIEENDYPYRIAFGHWETIDFNSDVFINRQVPKKVLKYFNYVITGHEHKPKLTITDNVPILTVGSMIPYAFGEQLDVEENVNYVTTTIDCINSNLQNNELYYEFSCVRILVDETTKFIVPNFKCLSKTFKNIIKQTKTEDVENESEKVDSVTSFSCTLSTFMNENEDIKVNSQFIKEIMDAFSTKDYKI